MKKIFAIILAVLMLLPCLAACAEDGGADAAETEGSAETSGSDKIDVTDEDIVLPPVRESKNPAKAVYAKTYTSMEELVDNTEVIAHIRVKNWLGDVREEQYRGVTCFEAEVINVYKGNISSEFVLIQQGTTDCTHKDYPLFIHGKEMILFLESAETSINNARENFPDDTYPDFEYENAYQIIGGPGNIWYVSTLDSGDTYIIPARATAVKEDYYADVRLKNLGTKESGTISAMGAEAARKLVEADNIDNGGYSPDYVFNINVLSEYVEVLCSE